MEKSTHHQRDQEQEEEFSAETVGGDDDTRSIRTIVPHELERVEEEDEEQIVKQEREQLEEDEDEDEERRARRVELGRLQTPEPMSLGMTHLSEDEEDELRRGSSFPSFPSAGEQQQL